MFQIISQGKGNWYDDKLNLDVHAITELQKLGIPPTDDMPKYKYKAKSDNKDTDYGENLECNEWI